MKPSNAQSLLATLLSDAAMVAGLRHAASSFRAMTAVDHPEMRVSVLLVRVNDDGRKTETLLVDRLRRVLAGALVSITVEGEAMTLAIAESRRIAEAIAPLMPREDALRVGAGASPPRTGFVVVGWGDVLCKGVDLGVSREAAS